MKIRNISLTLLLITFIFSLANNGKASCFEYNVEKEGWTVKNKERTTERDLENNDLFDLFSQKGKNSLIVLGKMLDFQDKCKKVSSIDDAPIEEHLVSHGHFGTFELPLSININELNDTSPSLICQIERLWSLENPQNDGELASEFNVSKSFFIAKTKYGSLKQKFNLDSQNYEKYKLDRGLAETQKYKTQDKLSEAKQKLLKKRKELLKLQRIRTETDLELISANGKYQTLQEFAKNLEKEYEFSIKNLLDIEAVCALSKNNLEITRNYCINSAENLLKEMLKSARDLVSDIKSGKLYTIAVGKGIVASAITLIAKYNEVDYESREIIIGVEVKNKQVTLVTAYPLNMPFSMKILNTNSKWYQGACTIKKFE